MEHVFTKYSILPKDEDRAIERKSNTSGLTNNYNAFATACDDDSDLANVIRKAVGPLIPIIAAGRKVPKKWLWHGGRLLPALLHAAGKQVAMDTQSHLCMAMADDYSLLPRACNEVPDGLVDACEIVLRRLPVISGLYLDVDPLITELMEDVIQNEAETDDGWYWAIFQDGGPLLLLLLKATLPPSWQHELHNQ